MKTQRRHELQTNVLADRVGRYIQEIRPHLRTVGIVFLAVVVLLAAGMFLMNRQSAQRGVGWSAFLEAFGSFDPKALEEVAKLHSGSSAGLWAKQTAGDIKLAEGARGLYTGIARRPRNC